MAYVTVGTENDQLIEIHYRDHGGGQPIVMEFLVEFEVHIPDGTPDAVARGRATAESAAAATLAEQGHLVRLWSTTEAGGPVRALGLYRADTRAELDTLLAALPLYVWMRVTVTALEPHPNDPAAAGQRR